MKVKQRREDFIVREVSRLRLGNGPHAIYRLKKSGIGTAEALRQAAHAWNIPYRRMRYGGRKDRHAITEQFVSIAEGPRKDLEEQQFSLQYAGQSANPISAKDILANEFEIRIRRLSTELARRMYDSATAAERCVPNYFGPQRFGSIGISGEMIARPWCLGDYERALYLALAEENRLDSPSEREQKRILREHWGDWQHCKQQLERSNRRSVITYLVDHPEGFKKAVALIDREMRSLYVSAFQSRLWNQLVSLLLEQQCASYRKIKLGKEGPELAFPTEFEAEKILDLGKLRIPLPSSRPTQWPTGIRKLLESVCSEYHLRIHQLRFSHPRDVFFSRNRRPALLSVDGMRAEVEADELSEQDHRKLILQFRLPAGQYASTLINALEVKS